MKTLSSYIKEELNCLEFEIRENEEEYVIYNSDPDNKQIGQALQKLYNKTFKEKLNSLTREQILTYLKEGKLEVDGVEI